MKREMRNVARKTAGWNDQEAQGHYDSTMTDEVWLRRDELALAIAAKLLHLCADDCSVEQANIFIIDYSAEDYGREYATDKDDVEGCTFMDELVELMDVSSLDLEADPAGDCNVGEEAHTLPNVILSDKEVVLHLQTQLKLAEACRSSSSSSSTCDPEPLPSHLPGSTKSSKKAMPMEKNESIDLPPPCSVLDKLIQDLFKAILVAQCIIDILRAVGDVLRRYKKEQKFYKGLRNNPNNQSA